MNSPPSIIDCMRASSRIFGVFFAQPAEESMLVGVSRMTSFPTRNLSRSSWVMVSRKLFCNRTLAIPCCRLDTVSYCEIFEDPFCRLFRLISCDLSFGLLECLEFVNKMFDQASKMEAFYTAFIDRL